MLKPKCGTIWKAKLLGKVRIFEIIDSTHGSIIVKFNDKTFQYPISYYIWERLQPECLKQS